MLISLIEKLFENGRYQELLETLNELEETEKFRKMLPEQQIKIIHYKVLVLLSSESSKQRKEVLIISAILPLEKIRFSL